MPPRTPRSSAPTAPALSLEAVEAAFRAGAGPAAVALVGSDSWLVGEARGKLAAALEESGTEVRPWDGDAGPLADGLRNGSLFGSGTAFVVEDPEWLGVAGDGKRRLAALVKSVRDGKGDPAKRLAGLVASRGTPWNPDDQAAMRGAVNGWLEEAGADESSAAVVRELAEKAIAARVEAGEEANPVGLLAPALEGIAAGNRMLLVLSSVPAKTGLAAALLEKLAVVPVEFPPGSRRAFLEKGAKGRAAEEGIRFAPGALELLLDRTAPAEADPRNPRIGGEGEGSVRLFRTELDKLLVSAGPNGTITRELVESLVDDASSVGAWDFDGFVASRDLPGALGYLRRRLGRPMAQTKRASEEILFLGLVAGQFRRIVSIHHLLGDQVTEAARSPYPAWQVRWAPRLAPLVGEGKSDYPLYKSMAAAAAFRADEARGALRRIASIDRRAKTGGPGIFEQLEGFLLAVLPRRGGGGDARR